MRLDLSDESWDAALPPEGAYRADVADIRLFMSNSGDRELCELTFKLDTGQCVSELVNTWVDRSLLDWNDKVGPAKRLLGQLAGATGIALPANSEDLPKTYLGQRVLVVVAHKVKGGLKTAVIKQVRADDGW